MLQHEIEPYAELHIKNNFKAQDDLNALLVTGRDLTESQIKSLTDTIETLKDNNRALNRFKICSLDEWKQKERYEKYAKENGYPYS